MPSISVVVPTRMRNHLLPRALASLLVQTWRDLEVVVVDDNPPDGRIDRERNLARYLDDPRVRVVINHHPRNAATARNVGLRVAEGEWVSYLDDDDAYSPDKLEKQEKLARDTSSPIVLCGIAYHLPWRVREIQMARRRFVGQELLLDVHAATSGIFHRNTRSVFFDERLHAAEDAHYFLALVRHFAVTEVHNLPEPLVHMYPQPSVRVNTHGENMWRGHRRIYLDFGREFGSQAARIYLARALLIRAKYQRGEWRKAMGRALRLLRLTGKSEVRPIVNALVAKVAPLRRFVVT